MEEAEDDKLLVNLNVGTLAVIVLVVVTTCSIVTLISLYCWYRSSSHTSIHCARCHQSIGVHGLPLPPQSAPPVPPYGLVHNVPPVEYRFQHPPSTHTSLTSKPVQNHQQPQNLPAIVVNQPDSNVQCGDSATFQRLGMRRPDCGITNDARGLETRALSSVQASPPEVTTPGLEPLTPSPVLSGNNQLEWRRGRRVQVADEPVVRQCVSFQHSVPEPSKLQQVRMVNFPSFQTPCAKTPGNALKTKRSSLKGSSYGQKSVSTLQPSQLFLAGHDRESDQPLLDVSEMCSTAITTGDLRDLCEDTAEAETSLSHPYKDILSIATSPGAALTPSPGATLTPAASITPASLTLRTPAPHSMSNPSPLTSLGSTLTPNKQYILSQLELREQAQYPDQLVTDRRTEPSSHPTNSECEERGSIRKQDVSLQIVQAGQDIKVMDRRSLTSPHLAITGNEKNVTDRRSLVKGVGGTAPLPITSSDILVTRRMKQHSTSPANVFVFNKNFDPAQPHQEGGNAQYQHPFSDLQVIDKNQAMPPGDSMVNNSINDPEKSAGSLKKPYAVVTPCGDKHTFRHHGRGLDRSLGKTASNPPRTVLDRSGGSGKKVGRSATPGLDKSVSSSGTRQRNLPPQYPDRPRSERKSAGHTGTYTKSPNT